MSEVVKAFDDRKIEREKLAIARRKPIPPPSITEFPDPISVTKNTASPAGSIFLK